MRHRQMCRYFVLVALASYVTSCGAEGAHGGSRRSGCHWKEYERVSYPELKAHLVKFVPFRLELYRGFATSGQPETAVADQRNRDGELH